MPREWPCSRHGCGKDTGSSVLYVSVGGCRYCSPTCASLDGCIRCSGCDEWHFIEDAIRTEHGRFCDYECAGKAAERAHRKCPVCGQERPKEQAHSCENCNGAGCARCTA